MTKLLLVEDNEMNRDVLSRRLMRKGFTVELALNGEEALEKAVEELPDLILMDLSLPIMDGWEATRRLKADEKTASIPIIALTAHAMSGDRAKAIEAGCDDYDTKPLDFPRLLTKIESLLSIQQSEAQQDNPSVKPVSPQAPPTFRSDSELKSKPEGASRGRVLVVDDNSDNRDLLIRRLEKNGFEFDIAENGEEALKALEESSFDLVLLDIMMPIMDGYQVLQQMKADTGFRHIPVIVISASQELSSIVKCIEMGADDYLPKPCDQILLKARIDACIEKKQLRDQELIFRERIEKEKKRSDDLLHAIFPHFVVQELKTTNEFKPRSHQNVAVLFCDIVGFTSWCEKRTPEQVVEHLQKLVTSFEEISNAFDVQKIKTIGDEYMAVSGLLTLVENPVLNCVKCGLQMIESTHEVEPDWQIRIGIHSGPVVTGIVGKSQYALDIWGDTVNTASRVERAAEPDRICLSGSAWQHVELFCRGASRIVDVRGKGPLEIVQFKGFL